MISPKKILIMKFRNIGDVLLVTPLISNLKYHFPDALIDVALNKGTEEMITLNPNVNDIIIYDRQRIKSLNPIQKLFEEVKFGFDIKANHYDLVINTTKGDRGNFIALISKAQTKIGYRSKNIFLKHVFDFLLPLNKHRHMVDIGLDSMNILNLPVIHKKVEIFWNDDNKNKVDNLLPDNQFIHIHPVSRWFFKCIDDRTMAKIIDYCINTLKKEVILTAAPVNKELDKIKSILNYCESKPINLSGKLSLKETAYLNSKARYFIGVDTSIMHISAANSTPVLAFFGPTAAYHWGPWDNDLYDSQYTQTKGNQKMGKHTILQKNWDCVPCLRDGCNGSKISDCLIQLNIEKILKFIKI